MEASMRTYILVGIGINKLMTRLVAFENQFAVT